jgi:hypothetical protein
MVLMLMMCFRVLPDTSPISLFFLDVCGLGADDVFLPGMSLSLTFLGFCVDADDLFFPDAPVIQLLFLDVYGLDADDVFLPDIAISPSINLFIRSKQPSSDVLTYIKDWPRNKNKSSLTSSLFLPPSPLSISLSLALFPLSQAQTHTHTHARVHTHAHTRIQQTVV